MAGIYQPPPPSIKAAALSLTLGPILPLLNSHLSLSQNVLCVVSSNEPVAEHGEGDQDALLTHKDQGPSLSSKTDSAAPGRGAARLAHTESLATLEE